MSAVSVEERLLALEQFLKKPAQPPNEFQAAYCLDIYSEGEEGKIILTRYYYVNHFKIYSDSALAFRTLIPYSQYENVGGIEPQHYPAANPGESPLHYYERMRVVPDFEELTCRYEDYIKFFIRGHVTYKVDSADSVTITDYQRIARKTEGNGTVVPMKRKD